MAYKLAELIERAPWREAVTCHDTWPHEYVLTRKDNPARTAGGRLQKV